MALIWFLLVSLNLGTLTLAQYYDEYEGDGSYFPYWPRKTPYFRRPSYGSYYWPKIQNPEELFSYGLPKIVQPNVRPEKLFPGGLPAPQGRFRVQMGEAITDELKDNDDTVFMKKTSGSNPPALPFGLDKIGGEGARMLDEDDDIPQKSAERYWNAPEPEPRNLIERSTPDVRRTFSLLANMLNPGSATLERERDLNAQYEYQRQQDRMADMRLQTKLDGIRSQNQIDNLRSDLRGAQQYDRFYDHDYLNYNYDRERQRNMDFERKLEYDRELELQHRLDEERMNSRLDQIERESRLQSVDSDLYHDSVMKSKLTVSKPELTTKSRLRVTFPVWG